MSDTRSERDSLGTVQVPADRLWGAQTQRALEHFRISSETMPGPLILALAEVKRACAQVNRDLGGLDPPWPSHRRGRRRGADGSA
jgi:fumarate hydratase class II